ncbi:MAG TPA: pyridoxamine 5'-phosphate oxidase family protein [Acidimicrobiia bacterium]|nr:pyridoxamine 5'-phosphate oxidase family protein [Acidimicrobiia bacterium]
MTRKDITFTSDEVAAYLETGRTVIVGSHNRDGSVHLAPMWYVMDRGKIVFRSFTKSQKIVNLQRDPRITVLVETGEAYAELQGIMIRGTATLVDDPAFTLRIYGRLAAKYAMVGDAPVELHGEALEATFGRFAPKNTSVIVEPRKITSWDHTKLGGEY